MGRQQLTIRRGTNLPRMGDFNESVVLDAIRRVPEGLSRVELAGATGLSAQTVSNICRRLLDHGLARETGKKSSGTGKPRTLLQVSPEARFAVGVHLDPAVITYVVLDLLGRVVTRLRTPTPRVADPDHTLAGISASLQTLIEESGVPRERILGVGIAAPGPVDMSAGLVVDPPELEGWGRVPLRDFLSAETGLPVLLDKDVIAAATAEHWAGAATDTGNFLFFYLGTGSGMGLVVEDTVLRGVSGNAGEVGGLGAACTTRAMVDEGIQLGVLGHEFTPLGPRDAERGLAELSRLAEENATAGDIIDRWAVRVGRGVAAAATLVDAELIVFGGPIWTHLRERFLRIIPDMVEQSPFVKKIHPTKVTSTGVGEDVGAVGAACLVLDRTLSARPQSLLLR
ncbi:ROK family transcriptional regulator [Streptomyces profundus]|uniref:ROK family transcriptional regulator n=1 Tax=Streptomyces profundus TaxID=2867410 RepID=UPI001D16840E|nr:ROK family transcriptional regulator [Streptomyces sp. MA3_2.13]